VIIWNIYIYNKGNNYVENDISCKLDDVNQIIDKYSPEDPVWQIRFNIYCLCKPRSSNSLQASSCLPLKVLQLVIQIRSAILSVIPFLMLAWSRTLNLRFTELDNDR